jgi:hypothetical protein
MRLGNPILIITIFAFLLLAPLTASADNNVTVVAPGATGGTYGTQPGQIDSPIGVQVLPNDDIAVLQFYHVPGTSRARSAITIFDKALRPVKTFFITKKSMENPGWEVARPGAYYDDLASAFAIGSDGKFYVLCGWDVVVLDQDGNYILQFTVTPYMGWIGKTGGDTTFYYPHGIVVTNDGYVVVSSGASPDKHELISMYPDGRLSGKKEVPVANIFDITRDRDGNLYVIGDGSKVIRKYDPTLTRETDIPLEFNGTYNGNPSSLAFLSGSNISASANGIFVYSNDSNRTVQFMDNGVSPNNARWERPIAANSTDWLIVVSGKKDAGITAHPLILYQFKDGNVVGVKESFNMDVNLIWGVALGFVALIWIVAAIFIIRKSM